mmetsp:Transcript_9267/g.18515  ORF Transcript_9267/g.18515 Transcript_9267/m.18515 type:complete len:182 (+) Transcript_9267:33-578(+)|eukprot:CAMPEP_0181341314 /NCGR_PEP_ID=MMETSP1101-20121128/30340_1 /TAXON_ID=46948 /ORGANISM="Rhodomonas abbreviata, Strain Caron Lab Isolate" /LENGTH=181 /DNA_ID=CAMNT_0023452575 /DNA_START=6 /DNA_END=551 /DNA_ORIENTATION=-
MEDAGPAHELREKNAEVESVCNEVKKENALLKLVDQPKLRGSAAKEKEPKEARNAALQMVRSLEKQEANTQLSCSSIESPLFVAQNTLLSMSCDLLQKIWMEQDFKRASSFQGQIPGYVFLVGGRGLGYYWDEGPNKNDFIRGTRLSAMLGVQVCRKLRDDLALLAAEEKLFRKKKNATRQ